MMNTRLDHHAVSGHVRKVNQDAFIARRGRGESGALGLASFRLPPSRASGNLAGRLAVGRSRGLIRDP
jgi:hypothetical protein